MTDSPVWASAAPEKTTKSKATTWAARAIGSSLFGELGRAPLERGAQAFLLSDLVELHPDIGPRRIERRQHVEPGTDRIAKARRVGAAVDRELGSGQRLGSDQRHLPRKLQRRRHEVGARHHTVDQPVG